MKSDFWHLRYACAACPCQHLYGQPGLLANELVELLVVLATRQTLEPDGITEAKRVAGLDVRSTHYQRSLELSVTDITSLSLPAWDLCTKLLKQRRASMQQSTSPA
eukprot:5269587-Amphidinium_carterae.1